MNAWKTSFLGVAAVLMALLNFAPSARGQSCPADHGRWHLQSWYSIPDLVRLSGDRAYLGTRFSWNFAEILDLSDLEGPRVIGAVSVPGLWLDFDVSANRLIALTWQKILINQFHLFIVDVSVPSNPVILGSSGPLPGYPRALSVSGDFVYLAGDYGLRVLDVTDPASIVEVGFLQSSWGPVALAVEGDIAYVALFDGGVRIIDVSDPARPVEVGWDAASWQARDLEVSGGIAYVAAGSDGLRLIDPTYSAMSVERGSLATPSDAVAVSVEGSVATVGLAEAGFWLVDVSDPANPQRIGGFAAGEPARTVEVEEGVAYAIVGPSEGLPMGGFRVVDLSTPASATERASFGFDASTMDVEVSSDVTYVAAGDSGLFILDRTNDGRYFVEGFLDTPGFARGVTPRGDLVLVADGPKGVRVIDSSDPANMVEVGFVDTPGQARSIAVAGDHAYVADGPGGLRVIDVSNPETPIEVGSVTTPAPVLDVAVDGDVAYVADGSLRVVDVSDPSRPLEIDTAQEFCADRVAVAEGLLYAACSNQRSGYQHRLDTLEMADPSHLQLLASTPLRGEPVDVEVSDGQIFVATRAGEALIGGGLDVLDNQNVHVPAAIGRWECANIPAAVAVSGGSIYVADRTSDLAILDARCLTTYWVEIVTNEKGLGGSDWRSDVVIHHANERMVPIEFVLHTDEGEYSAGASVQPGQQAVFEDIVGLLGHQGRGVLEIQARLPISIVNHVFSTAGSGTVGTFSAGYRGSECSGRGELYGLRQVEGKFRTNISVTNTTTESRTVRISLHRSDGKVLTEYTLEVPPEAVVLDVQPFKLRAGQPDLGWGFASIDGGEGILASGFVIDSKTNDPAVVQLVGAPR